MKRDNGFSLIVAIFVILILSLLMIFSTSMFSTDIEIALDSLRSTQALFMCEGAIDYCIKHELIDDSDWSDNTDIINKSLGQGVFSIYYDLNTIKDREVTIQVVATVDDITRQITQSFKSGGWPKEYEDFPYSLFIGEDLRVKYTSNISIEEPSKTYAPSCPTIDCDFDYYQNIADVRKETHWYINTENNQVYTGIYHINGNLVISNSDNITIYGSIISTGGIIFNGCQNIEIIPSDNYPALVSQNYIIFQKWGFSKSCENIVIRGPIFTKGYISLYSLNNFQIDGIMNAEIYIKILYSSNFTVNGSIIANSYIMFNDCDPVLDINWDSKILDEPPGFTWIGVGGPGIIMGKWDEAL